MLKKTLNIALICVTTLILMFPVVTICMTKLGFEFPEESGIGATTSQLEGRKYAHFTAPTVENIKDGTFQSKLEKYVSDHVPFRASLLLFDAARERVAIACSASLVGYSTYPTFYGAKYYAIPQDRIVLEGSALIPSSSNKLNKWIDLLNRTANEHPETKMSVHYVLEPKQDSMNPTYDLSGGDGLIDGDWVQRELVDKQSELIESRIVPIGSLENMKSDWYRTDHHWNLKAALNAYNDIADIHDLQRAEWDAGKEVLFVDKWQGTAARSGRDYDYPDNLIDQSDDFSNLHYYKLGHVKAGSEISAGSREPFLKDIEYSSDSADEADESNDVYTAAYSTYYGGQNMEIINDGDNNGKTCLFIGDSYSRCLYRYIANNYKHTIYILPGNYKMTQRLDDFYEKYPIDDMIVVVHAEKYTSIYDDSPSFFEKSTGQ